MSEFENGFLCGILGSGMGITTGKYNTSKLPAIDRLSVINLNAYDCVETRLNENTYQTLVSNSFEDIPNKGYVLIGGYDLYNNESRDDQVPQADIRITVDGKPLYEGDIQTCFKGISLDPPYTFQYESSFEVAAKRRNKKDNLTITLNETMIIGLK